MVVKKGLKLTCLIVFGLFLWAASAQAMPLVGMNYNGLYFNNAEVFLNLDNSYDQNTGQPTITPGDIFWGVYNLQNIKGPTDPAGAFGPEIWHSDPNSNPAEITGYFATQVVNTIPNGAGNTDVIVFGPTQADPNGILNPGEVFRVYEDTNKDYNDAYQTIGLQTATNGQLLWSLGLGPSSDGDSTGGYWYSNAPIIIPGPNSPVGTSYAGLNFMGTQNTPDGTSFKAIDDPNETYVNSLVELWLNSEIFQVHSIGATDPNGNALFEFSSNDPAVVYPIPEPATMLLLGTGMIGLVGVGRKKLRVKKS